MQLLTIFIFMTIGTVQSSWAKSIRLAVAGDIMMGTIYPENKLPDNNGRDLFVEAQPYLRSADLRLANLEGPLLDDSKSTTQAKSSNASHYLFRTPVSYGARLKDAGFQFLSLANNHAKDFGQAGLDSTKQTLSKLGIQYSSKDGEVAKFQIQGLKISVLAVDYFTGKRSLVTPDSTFKEIEMLKQKSDLVLVSAHAGGEGIQYSRTKPGVEIYLNENRGDLISFAHQALDAGADLVFMHGPHVPRAIEIYNQKLILYSLGNFLTEQGIGIQDQAGYSPLALIQIDQYGRFESGKIISFNQVRKKGLALDPSQKAYRRIVQMTQLDFQNANFSFQSDGSFTHR